MSLDFQELEEQTIQSQYGASPHIRGVIEAFGRQIDPTTDIATFREKVFDPNTAEGIGLDIWGRIVGAGRYLMVDNTKAFAFLGSLLQGWNQAPFFVKGDTNLFRMNDEAFRFFIFLKAAANIGEATLPSIKNILYRIFDNKTVYVYPSNLPMTVRVVFPFFLSPYERALLTTYGLLNLGAGVGFEYYQADPNLVLGFRGSGFQSFGHGAFNTFGIYYYEGGI